MKLHRPQLLGLISLAALTLVVPIAAVALAQGSSSVSTPAATAAVPLSPALVAQSAPEPKVPPPAAAAPVPPAAANPPAEVPAASAPPPQPRLTQAELDQLVAPIALYPDQLLTQVLMASTFPVEVIAAARWIRDPANRGLTGDALMRALRERNWDPSVMALVPFPRVLELMCDQIGWTEKLGVAFVVQQADVMNAVRQLRLQAAATGNLKSGQQCQCIVGKRGGYVTLVSARRGASHHYPYYAYPYSYESSYGYSYPYYVAAGWGWGWGGGWRGGGGWHGDGWHGGGWHGGRHH